MMSTFSFVMPAYKAEFIRESIDSILGQTNSNLELIVVDDCSSEPIGEIVKGYDDSRLTYYRNDENIGGKDLVAQWNKCQYQFRNIHIKQVQGSHGDN